MLAPHAGEMTGIDATDGFDVMLAREIPYTYLLRQRTRSLLLRFLLVRIVSPHPVGNYVPFLSQVL